MDGIRLLRPVRLRHGRHADERTLFDVGERRFDHGRNSRRFRELHLQVLAGTRLNRERIPIDFGDFTADAHRRALRPHHRCRQQTHSGGAKHATCHLLHLNTSQTLCGGHCAAAIKLKNPTGIALFQLFTVHLARSISTKARNSAVTCGRTPNHSAKPRTA